MTTEKKAIAKNNETTGNAKDNYVTPRQKELLPKIEALFEENQELKARNQDLETQIKQLETEAQELKKPWWKRFFRRREQ